MTDLIFKSWFWKEYINEDTDKSEILISGRDINKKTVMCIVEDFEPFVYLELPSRINWDSAKCAILFKYFRDVMKDCAPVRYETLAKFKLHYKVLTKCMCLHFKNASHINYLKNKCHSNKYGLVINPFGTFKNFEFKVHEDFLGSILKFTAMQNLKLSSWLIVKDFVDPEEDEDYIKFSNCDIELRVKWNKIKAYKPDKVITVNPKFISWDIECYSKNHNSKLPNGDEPENVIILIGNTLGVVGESHSTYKKVIFTVYDMLDIEDVEIIRCGNDSSKNISGISDTEAEIRLILAFMTWVIEINPDALIGYNTTKFDWNYLIARAKVLGIYDKFIKHSRILGGRADYAKLKWESSAYKKQEFFYIDIPGITNVDVLTEIERNYKLPLYNLNVVSQFFLKEQKDDITPRQLFMMTKMMQVLYMKIVKLPKGIVKKSVRVEIKKTIQNTLIRRYCAGEVSSLRKALMKVTRQEDFLKYIKKAIFLIGKYCIQDTALVVRLMDKLILWTAMEEMSNCTNVPISYLHTRGQQIKVVSQLYYYTSKEGIIIPFQEKKDKINFQGAIVIEANPGDYDNVACFDFESLYPTTMITFNICYTTLIIEEKIDKNFKIKIDEIGKYYQLECGDKIYWNVETNPDTKVETFIAQFVIYNGETNTKGPSKINSRIKNIMNISKLEYNKENFDFDEPDRTESLYHIIKWNEHKNCIHTLAPGKRVRKNDKVFCMDHYYRFKKVIIHPDGTKENEGIMPRLVRELLSDRKIKKKDMFKLQVEYDSAKGLMKPEDIEEKKKWGLKVHNPGDLTKEQMDILKVGIDVCNAQQLALKVSANSSYGFLGAQSGMIPLVEGAASVTAMGRMLIMKAINYIRTKYAFAKLVYGDSVTGDTELIIKLNDVFLKKSSIEDLYNNFEDKGIKRFDGKDIIDLNDLNIKVMSDTNKVSDRNFTQIKKIIRHFTNKNIYKITTEIDSNKFSTIKVTEDHSLLDENYKEISPKDLKIGDFLPILPSLILNENLDTKTKTKVINIENLGPYSDYVYDLETKNHHFAVGNENIVVHNTDSGMVRFDGKDTIESFQLGNRISKETSHYLKCFLCGFDENYEIELPSTKVKYRIDKFPRDKIKELDNILKVQILYYDYCPINLQFENLYKRYFLLTKKRYLSIPVTEDGKEKDLIKKGVVLSRRDNSQYLRDTYKKVTDAVMNKSDEETIMNIIYDRVNMLFTMQIPYTHFIINMGVNDLLSYAKKEKNTEKDGKPVYLDKDKRPIDNLTGPFDPRLVYTNIPQVILSRKILNRGCDIPANTRLEFLYIENENATKQGQKAEDYSYFKEHRREQNLRPDKLHYIEKQLAKPLTEMVLVKFPRERIIYEKLEDKLNRLMFDSKYGVNELYRYKLKNLKVYENKVEMHLDYKTFKSPQGTIKTPPGTLSKKPELNSCVGWAMICDKCWKFYPEKCDTHQTENILKDLEANKYIDKNNPLKNNEIETEISKKTTKKATKKTTKKTTTPPIKNEKVIPKIKRDFEIPGRAQRDWDSLRIPDYRIYKYKKILDGQIQYILDQMKLKKQSPKMINGLSEEDHLELKKVCLIYKSKMILDRLATKYKIKKRQLRKPTNASEKLRLGTVKDGPTQVMFVSDYKKYKRGTLAILKEIHAEEIPTNTKKKSYNYTFDLEIIDPLYKTDPPTILKDVERSVFNTFYYKDDKFMKIILLARGYYKCVVEHLNQKFKGNITETNFDFEIEESVEEEID